MSEVDDFLEKYPAPTRQRLEQIRHIITSEAPQLIEGLKWGKLAYSNDVIMVMVEAYKNYMGLHITKTTIAALEKVSYGNRRITKTTLLLCLVIKNQMSYLGRASIVTVSPYS